MNAATLESAQYNTEKSMTQQEFAEETDINYIAERYGLNGTIPQVLELPRYGDFTGLFDYQSAQNAVIEGKRQFMTLPAKVRARFQNDPQQLLTFLEDPENREEAIAIGLVEKPGPKPPEPQPVGKGEETPPKQPTPKQ